MKNTISYLQSSKSHDGLSGFVFPGNFLYLRPTLVMTFEIKINKISYFIEKFGDSLFVLVELSEGRLHMTTIVFGVCVSNLLRWATEVVNTSILF